LQFCSRFKLHDGNLGQLQVAAKIMGVENGFDGYAKLSALAALS
jgi:hypothetical protein